jgi:DNA-binding NarL/FixJ family response regulator
MNYLFAPESIVERQSIFLEICEAIGPDDRLEMFPDIVGFSAGLRQLDNPEIIIMLAVGKTDMPDILSLRTLIRDAAIIILLSDEEKDTVTSAIRLRPKFIGSMNGDLEKVVPIVEKLIQTKIARESKCSTILKRKQRMNNPTG